MSDEMFPVPKFTMEWLDRPWIEPAPEQRALYDTAVAACKTYQIAASRLPYELRYQILMTISMRNPSSEDLKADRPPCALPEKPISP